MALSLSQRRAVRARARINSAANLFRSGPQFLRARAPLDCYVLGQVPVVSSKQRKDRANSGT